VEKKGRPKPPSSSPPGLEEIAPRSTPSLGDRGGFDAISQLERDELWFNRHPALAFCLRMIFSENRFPLFRIML
jgi:hypothetical protein